MKSRFLILFTTFVGFAAGIVADQWVQRHQPCPKPPPGALSDIHGNPGHPDKPSPEALAAVQADIEAYRAKVEPMRTAFRAKLTALLTPEQKAKFEKHPKLGPGGPKPHFGEPGWAPLALVFITPTADYLKESLGLSESQRADLLLILKDERARFFEFSDANPPPSFKLNQLAPAKP